MCVTDRETVKAPRAESDCLPQEALGVLWHT
jgi:hypothetical protein